MTLEKQKNYGKYDCNASLALTEDSQSLIEDSRKNQAKQMRTFRKNSIEIFSVKQLPTLFFIIFIIVLATLTAKFVPTMMNMSLTHDLYKDKLQLKYIPELLGDQSSAIKVNNILLRR